MALLTLILMQLYITDLFGHFFYIIYKLSYMHHVLQFEAFAQFFEACVLILSLFSVCAQYVMHVNNQMSFQNIKLELLQRRLLFSLSVSLEALSLFFEFKKLSLFFLT